MEAEGSLPYSQQPAIGLYIQLNPTHSITFYSFKNIFNMLFYDIKFLPCSLHHRKESETDDIRTLNVLYELLLNSFAPKFLLNEIMKLFVTRFESYRELTNWEGYKREITGWVISGIKGNCYCHLPAETVRKTEEVLQKRDWNVTTVLRARLLMSAFGGAQLKLFLSGLGDLLVSPQKQLITAHLSGGNLTY